MMKAHDYDDDDDDDYAFQYRNNEIAILNEIISMSYKRIGYSSFANLRSSLNI